MINGVLCKVWPGKIIRCAAEWRREPIMEIRGGVCGDAWGRTKEGRQVVGLLAQQGRNEA